MAKVKPNIPEGFDVNSFVLAKCLAQDANVLFIYNKDYEKIKNLKELLNIKVSILNDDFEELEKARKFGFEVISGNVNAGVLDDMQNKQFDYIVCEDELHSARYPNDVLKSMVRVCNNLVLCNKNKANWRKRLNFFFRGSMYVDNQYDVIPDDKYAWFNRYPWCLSHKDIVNLCACNDYVIKKGTIIYKNGLIDNMYDIRSYPNWSAYKVYYIISDESTIKTKSYQFGGQAI